MAGAKFYQGIDTQNQRVQNVGSPSVSTDAANKAYVDGLVQGLSWKTAVRAATTTTGTLATAYANGQVIDGVTLATGDRILLKNQSAGAENGIYTVNASGAPTRATDMDASSEAVNNTTVMVSEGTTLADTAWTLTNNGVITLGTTALTWAQVGGGATYTAGNGINISSNIITAVVKGSGGLLVDGTGLYVDTSIVSRKYAANIGNGSNTSLTVNHNLGTRDVDVTIYNASTYELIYADVVFTDTNNVTVTFATAPASNAYRVVVTG